MASNSYLVAGASRGIGLALVFTLVQRNKDAIVFAAARNPQNAKDNLKKQFGDKLTQEQLNRVHYIQLDVTDDDSIAKARKDVGEDLHRLGLKGLNVLLVNAGILGDVSPFPKVTRKEILAAYNTNVAGVVLVAQAFDDLLEASGSAKIAIVSSLAGSIGYFCRDDDNAKLLANDFLLAYRASKTAINAIAQGNLQAHFSKKGIPVLVLHPGVVDTDMADESQTKGIMKDIITPLQSATGIVDVIQTKKLADQRTFWNYDGTALLW